jgi:tRNA 2-thiocytidine biosynthesis protein TtcA
MTSQLLFKRIKRLTGQAIGDFNLIEDSDRILVALSGGKDSWAMLYVMTELCRRAPIHYQLVPVTIDSGFNGFNSASIVEQAMQLGYNLHVEHTNAQEIIGAHLRSGSSDCAFCARLRRGALYSCATKLGCNKVALGHHLDDHIETLLLNQFYSGSIAAMSPKLMADNGEHTLIRPLVYVEETMIEAWINLVGIKQVDCSCPAVKRRDQKRQNIKQLLAQLSVENPRLKKSLLKAMGNVKTRHLLDKNLKEF